MQLLDLVRWVPLRQRQPQSLLCRSRRLRCHRQTPNKSATFVTNGAAAGGDQTTVVTAIDIAAMTMRGLAIIDDPMATMAGMRMVVVAGITVGTTTTTDDIDEVLALSIMRQLKFTGALLSQAIGGNTGRTLLGAGAGVLLGAAVADSTNPCPGGPPI
ncbi:hypothetical protein Nham_0961 [Nitrobacter hamburgensis X14]|uniref:Uncharacterized protein n=1 Tax=Nitrobacter hamburgensis (strain DSM 10229 / NCIMB 13809 / X14) TaxID=323097 RepID=Q1QPN3_NITHX|nr:hypothetical protein Nham_0961 [Nitrobacter hamburgensis X14]